MKRQFILIALAVASGCAAATVPQERLEGTSWQIVNIDGASAISDRAKISFDNGKISATVGCNGMGGSVSFRSGTLVVGPMVGTMMYCEQLAAQEKALSALLQERPRYRRDGDTLQLESPGHAAQLRRLP